MGCGGSKDSTAGSPVAGNHVVFERRPKISVRIGSKVQKLDNKPTLIFIFGKFDGSAAKLLRFTQGCQRLQGVDTNRSLRCVNLQNNPSRDPPNTNGATLVSDLKC